jgi:hypothetical protein
MNKINNVRGKQYQKWVNWYKPSNTGCQLDFGYTGCDRNMMAKNCCHDMYKMRGITATSLLYWPYYRASKFLLRPVIAWRNDQIYWAYRFFHGKTSYRSSTAMLNLICWNSDTRYCHGSSNMLGHNVCVHDSL